MKKIIFTIIMVLITFILQSTVFSWLSVGNIVPNLLIVLTALYGMTNGDTSGLVVGFFCGLLVDIFFGKFIGFNALLYMYIGYFNGKFHQNFYPEDFKLPLLLIFVSDFMYSFSYYCLMFMLRGKFEFSFYLKTIILPEVIYTTLLSFLIYPGYYFVNKKIIEKINGGITFV